MLDKIIGMIIEEAQSRRDKDITNSLLSVAAEITRILTLLSEHINQIQGLECSEEEKRVFIKSLLDKPIY